MLEDLFDHRFVFDSGNDADPSLAAVAGLDVDTENSFQKPGPMHTLFAGWDRLGFRNNIPAVLVMRSEHARVSRQVNPGTWN